MEKYNDAMDAVRTKVRPLLQSAAHVEIDTTMLSDEMMRWKSLHPEQEASGHTRWTEDTRLDFDWFASIALTGLNGVLLGRLWTDDDVTDGAPAVLTWLLSGKADKAAEAAYQYYRPYTTPPPPPLHWFHTIMKTGLEGAQESAEYRYVHALHAQLLSDLEGLERRFASVLCDIENLCQDLQPPL
jgi:hypothetical protein